MQSVNTQLIFLKTTFSPNGNSGTILNMVILTQHVRVKPLDVHGLTKKKHVLFLPWCVSVHLR